MKWFKHFSDMSEDVKVKRLIRKYGVAGYGLYCYVIERIVRRLETESPTPDLEETAADIADDLRMDTRNVEEIVKTCVDIGLFQLDTITGRVIAHKVYKFLQQSETRSPEIRKMITAYNNPSQTVIDKCEEQNRTEQNRTEQNRIEKNRTQDTLSGSEDATPTLHVKKDEHTEEAHKVLDYLNAESGKHFKYTAANIRPIKARLKEGFTFDDFRLVIDYKAHTWGGDPKMSEYVRPLTLFGTKFESYREEVR